jgi:hypothetical protein
MSLPDPPPALTRRFRLKPADPFDLIRLLARSQNDPRKAVAELVQNSLDAGAREVTVTRFRKGGNACLSVLDDGEGVLPDMDRADALQHIATHIGHSYKRRLTPEERYRLLQQGKYGIGLLGFWSVGRLMTIRSRVKGSDVFGLHLEEETPEGMVAPERGQKLLEPTWTEVTIRDLHPAAQRLLLGRRLADYLAFELRGQLLGRDVHLRVLDRLARGTAQKDILVRPPRFQGVPLREVAEWPVEGHPPLRVELHYLPEEHGPGRVALACAGTAVTDDLPLLEAVDLKYPPWDGGRLTGIVDAPFLEVAPGTRRGIVPDAKAEAFAAAMRALANRVREWLSAYEKAAGREADRTLHKRLRQVFRELQRRLPHYELFPVKDGAGRTGTGETLDGARVPDRERGDAAMPESGADEPPELFEPGPLESVRIVPAARRLPVGAEAGFAARALDATGRGIRGGVSFAWSLAVGPGRIETPPAKPAGAMPPGAARVMYHAEAVGTARIRVEATQEERKVSAEARVEVLEEIEPSEPEDIGIPEPAEVKDPAGRWRSRMRGGRWEFNASHPDYLMASRDPGRRFRYLATLLAKELVLRQVAGGNVEDQLLESLVEVLAVIEEKLGRAPRKDKGPKAGAGAAPAP